jgi:hypothetical protein
MLKITKAFAFSCAILFARMNHCNELDTKANHQVNEILAKHHLENSIIGATVQDGFRSLSPELLTGIAKSFYILDECLPTLLHEGSYLEFGLYKGFSLWFAQQMGNDFTGNNFHYFGFDSFAGLPNQSHDYARIWSPGAYAASVKEVTQYLKQYRADFSNLHLIPGWFSQKLFDQWHMQFSPTKSSIITIDSDVYESCREILQFFVNHLQPGTILLFDDFLTSYPNPPGMWDSSVNDIGERKALIEFLSNRPDVQLIHLFPFGWHGYAFMVVACNGQSLDGTIKEKVQAMIGQPELPEHPVF